MLKDFQVDLELSPRDNRVIQTGATYWSHDVNTAKIVINLKRNSEPIILSSTVSVRMIMVFDDNDTQKKQVHKMTIDDTQNGVVSLVLPKETLGFVGNVLCGVYVNYGENQSTDNGYFTFSMRRSLIDGEFPQLENGYVSEFQTMLDYMIETASEFDNVEEKLNKRIDVIEKDIASNEVAKQSEVSKINDELKNLQFGGVNLIRNSSTIEFSTYGGTIATHKHGVAVNEWNAKDAINVSGKGGEDAVILVLGTPKTIKSVIGNDYSHSVFIKNNSTNPITFANNLGSILVVNAGESKQLRMNSTAKSEGFLQFTVSTKSIGDTFDFDYWHPQIEQSSRASNWRPALEEMATKKDINEIQKQIDDIKKAITNLGGTL